MNVGTILEGRNEAQSQDCAAPLFHEYGIDPHEVRARELDALGKPKWAFQVRQCTRFDDRGRDTGPDHPFGAWVCRKRFCPSCGKVIASERRRKIVAGIGAMGSPVLVLATLGWRPLEELRKSIAELRGHLSAMRHGPLRGLRIVGSIEPKMDAERHLSNVHAHLVIDTSPETLARFQRMWTRLTKGTGKFRPEAGKSPRVRNAYALADYITKLDDWCPAPGTVSTDRLRILFDALHGARLAIITRDRSTVRRLVRSYHLVGDQCASVECAIASADRLGASDRSRTWKRHSRAISIICADYSLTEMTLTEAERARCLRVLEEAMGIQFILVDRGKIVHGAEAFRAARATYARGGDQVFTEGGTG